MRATAIPGMKQEDLLARYRIMVEENDPAIPIALIEDEQHQLNILALTGGSPADLLAAFARSTQAPVALGVVLSAETWVHRYAKDGTAIGLDEAIVITCLYRDGSGWGVTQNFTRTKTGVIWQEELEDAGKPEVGAMAEAMALLVHAPTKKEQK